MTLAIPATLAALWGDSLDAITLGTCGWLVDHGLVPEPDSAHDRIVLPCGAPLVRDDETGWACHAGHTHVTYGGPAYETTEANVWLRTNGGRREDTMDDWAAAERDALGI